LPPAHLPRPPARTDSWHSFRRPDIAAQAAFCLIDVGCGFEALNPHPCCELTDHVPSCTGDR
jgi:hypothetical protein